MPIRCRHRNGSHGCRRKWFGKLPSLPLFQLLTLSYMLSELSALQNILTNTCPLVSAIGTYTGCQDP